VRFVLDHNVDALLVTALADEGHTATTAARVGVDRAGDPNLAVWASDKGFVVVSHDKAFTAWRKKQTWGQHVQLKCSEAHALDVMMRWLSEVLGVLQHRPDVVITLQPTKYEVAPLSWEFIEAYEQEG